MSFAIATRTTPPVGVSVPDAGATDGLGVAVHAESASTNSEKRISLTSRGYSARALLVRRADTGVESVTEPVANEVKREHREEDHQARRDDEVWRADEVLRRAGQHVAPRGRRRKD